MSGPVRIKICGLTRLADAELAVELGASAIGFIFWPRSPRTIPPADAAAIGRRLPAFVTRVGVFVDADADEVAAVIDAAGLDAIQLHGDEDARGFADVRARILKVVTFDDADGLAAARALPDAVTPLVDAVDRERRGGTGRRANWSLAAELAAARPIVLAGGLSADNVRDAIQAVRPWGIDVSSGVEERPGIKSASRMRALFDRVRALEREAL